eukprot:6476361-Amphidinium_carterae.1
MHPYASAKLESLHDCEWRTPARTHTHTHTHKREAQRAKSMFPLLESVSWIILEGSCGAVGWSQLDIRKKKGPLTT